ncbi:hypothetical protein RhiirA1_543900 [Rhizophagus irregularis]|uniref:Uncharacterized protein n=1 Tax=Rhizophagus irregularis TaxID=588596 RepID=A0A2N0QGV2_9GLOM|nr:hypothetical protein RhiirA1_543900 [Rhizophagus irregularis]
MEKMFVLNIDDYHNIHRCTIPSLLEIHNIFHFVTILLNSNLKFQEYHAKVIMSKINYGKIC